MSDQERIEKLERDLHRALAAHIEVVFYAAEDVNDPRTLRFGSGGFCFVGNHLYNAGDEEIATYSPEDGKWFVPVGDDPDCETYIYGGAEFTIGMREDA